MDPVRIEVPQTWTVATAERQCGNCTACCIYLGIEELKKYTGQKCKHLRSTVYKDRRCSIYSHRPRACSEYQCMWRAGFGPEWLRPADSGMIITCYDSEENPGKATATINVFDEAKAAGHINELIGNMITVSIIEEVRLVFLAQKRSIMFRDGFIYDVQLLPPDGYESLRFKADLDHPVGKYEVQNQK